MAIISFAKTTQAFLSGEKTVTRRFWSDKQLALWQKLWDSGKFVHDAWDNNPRAGGTRIGRFELTHRPYRERLRNMPDTDLEAEGVICPDRESFLRLLDADPEDVVSVIRFRKV